MCEHSQNMCLIITMAVNVRQFNQDCWLVVVAVTLFLPASPPTWPTARVFVMLFFGFTVRASGGSVSPMFLPSG
jgi:hypothetical protein